MASSKAGMVVAHFLCELRNNCWAWRSRLFWRNLKNVVDNFGDSIGPLVGRSALERRRRIDPPTPRRGRGDLSDQPINWQAGGVISHYCVTLLNQILLARK